MGRATLFCTCPECPPAISEGIASYLRTISIDACARLAGVARANNMSRPFQARVGAIPSSGISKDTDGRHEERCVRAGCGRVTFACIASMRTVGIFLFFSPLTDPFGQLLLIAHSAATISSTRYTHDATARSRHPFSHHSLLHRRTPYLGCYATGIEAALAIARVLGPEHSAAAADEAKLVSTPGPSHAEAARQAAAEGFELLVVGSGGAGADRTEYVGVAMKSHEYTSSRPYRCKCQWQQLTNGTRVCRSRRHHTPQLGSTLRTPQKLISAPEPSSLQGGAEQR